MCVCVYNMEIYHFSNIVLCSNFILILLYVIRKQHSETVFTVRYVDAF